MVYDQAAICGRRFAVQVKGYVPSRDVGYHHHVLPAVDCKPIVFFVTPTPCKHSSTDTSMIGYQRCPVLRPSDLQRLRSFRNHNVAVGKWCRWYRHVVRHHARGSLRRQTGPQTHPHHRCNRHGIVPYHHRRHLRQKRKPMGDSQRCGMGRSSHGMALCRPFRL